MSSETYLPQKEGLLKDFNRSISRGKQILADRYGKEEAGILVYESRQEYAALIPQIPYIGERNPMLNLFLVPASRYLAIYRAFHARGCTLEEIGQLVYELGTAQIQALPRLVRRLIPVLWFSEWFQARLQKRAMLSRQHRYPGDYVIEFIAGDGQDFDYGIDYQQCASREFYCAQDAEQLTPYLCAIDRPASELCGWGLTRTTTLASGGSCCDFRFKKNGLTRVEIPASLHAQE